MSQKITGSYLQLLKRRKTTNCYYYYCSALFIAISAGECNKVSQLNKTSHIQLIFCCSFYVIIIVIIYVFVYQVAPLIGIIRRVCLYCVQLDLLRNLALCCILLKELKKTVPKIMNQMPPLQSRAPPCPSYINKEHITQISLTMPHPNGLDLISLLLHDYFQYNLGIKMRRQLTLVLWFSSLLGIILDGVTNRQTEVLVAAD